jgi:1-acyl-sn-glycerol-3-phosphate acyltransferase
VISKLEQLRREARPYVRAAAFVGVTAGMSTLAETHMLFAERERRGQVWDFYYRRWARMALASLRVTLHHAAELPAETGRGRLVVANHRSPLDIAILASLVGGHTLSRADVADWPFIGRRAQLAGTIFVDRQDKRSGATAIRQIRERLKAGRTVTIFPEGTTLAGDALREFQAGAFVAVKDLDVDILPVGLAYPDGSEWTEPSFTAHASRVAKHKAIPVGVAVGEAFRSLGSARDDAAHAQTRVQDAVHAARRSVAER